MGEYDDVSKENSNEASKEIREANNYRLKKQKEQIIENKCTYYKENILPMLVRIKDMVNIWIAVVTNRNTLESVSIEFLNRIKLSDDLHRFMIYYCNDRCCSTWAKNLIFLMLSRNSCNCELEPDHNVRYGGRSNGIVEKPYPCLRNPMCCRHEIPVCFQLRLDREWMFYDDDDRISMIEFFNSYQNDKPGFFQYFIDKLVATNITQGGNCTIDGYYHPLRRIHQKLLSDQDSLKVQEKELRFQDKLIASMKK